jgi:hypothetical protein
MCGERNDTIPGGPPRVANEHEDSGYPIGQVKCGETMSWPTLLMRFLSLEIRRLVMQETKETAHKVWFASPISQFRVR